MAAPLTNPAAMLAFAPQAVPPELAAPLIAGDRPLALLPVRLETRFFAQADGTQELRIRVFPDQVHVDAHQPALGAGEIEWGQHFWQQIWLAGADESRRQAAWQQLADRFDAQRAAWIARALTPTNKPRPAPASPGKPRFRALTPHDGADGWSATPVARLMPRRWFAVARARGQVIGHARSELLTRAPALGPDVADAAPSGDEGDLAIDAGMRWMVDFDTAEREGMALRMRLPAAVAQAGIDTLLVFGVDDESGAADGAAALARLLDAHHYTDGLAFVGAGTPTNNTVEEPAGRDSADPGHARSYAAWRDALGQLAPQCQAERLARALGLDAATALASLGEIEGAAAREQLDARQAATALWGATWGYYLGNLIGSDGTGLRPDDIEWARQHFIGWVRAFGPLPTLRLGRQPYGVLPVTVLADWTPQDADAARELRLRDLLLTLRERLWRTRVDGVPRVGRSADSNTDAELALAMRSDGIAAGYQLRHLFGPRYLQHLRSFLGVDPTATGWWAAHDALSFAVLRELGFAWQPRIAAAAFAPTATALDAPLVHADDAAFIRSLLEASSLQLPGDARSLLQVLLRHALQLEYVATAARIARGAAAGAAMPPRDVELMNFNAQTRTTTWRERLAQPPDGGAAPSLDAFLRTSAGLQGDQAAALRALREALEHLATLDSASLQRLLVGTLDLCSHRLDAWITSLATRRLDAMRDADALGTHVGAYGWVLNLRPLPAAAPLPTPAGESGPVFALRDDPGFLHAPSLDQAQTAALLRNGHLGKANLQAQGAFAIDLSSRRTRIAAQLLDGVRQGQPLGALLGYRFERSLHERRLDLHIETFRQLAPLLSADAPPTPTTSESVAANRVVDGLRLHQKWQDLMTGPARPPASSPFVVCAAALRELDDAIDAMGDAVVAEAVYQAVRGNTVRASGTLSAIAHGEAPPPELDVVRTPRSGTGLTHRVLWLFAAPARTARPAGWPATSKSPRAAAEPRLNAWAASLLPAPQAVRFGVEALDGEGAVIARLDLRLTHLALTPLDLLAMAPPQPGAAVPELEALAMHVARGKSKKLRTAGALRVDARRRTDWPADAFSLREALEVAARARQCLGGARAAEPRDLTAAGDVLDVGVAVKDLEKRAKAAEKALRKAAAKLAALVAAPDSASVATWRRAMLVLQRFGFTGAVPGAPRADTAAERAALIAQSRPLAAEAARRLSALDAQRAGAAADSRQRAAAATTQLRTLFGPDFLPLTPFTAANGAELAASLAASTSLQGGDAMAVYGWWQRLARVRDGVGRLSAVLHAAEGIQAAQQPRLAVAQLPHVAGERWVGLPLPAGADLPAGKLSLVVQKADDLDPSKPMAGLWLDDWVEMVPHARENTGIAFQFDAPDACAPQTILLAVPPDPSRAWTPWTLHRLLLETLELATLRAVDAEAFDRAFVDPVGAAGAGVGEAAHFLPALCFAVNAEGDAVGPDFSSLR